MVRRKRVFDDGLNLPQHLQPEAVVLGPDGWKAARFEWSMNHNWGPQKLGLLAFFDETVCLHRTTLGLEPPIGSAQRYEQGLADAR